ncbi:hypothetical protein [Kitasatospora sp. NPDC057198]|uniref:hypothetical protein n=1 Tax=Kitasatospora sp. NPDC057198 TaxID=3346046 RepID=UPI003626177F
MTTENPSSDRVNRTDRTDRTGSGTTRGRFATNAGTGTPQGFAPAPAAPARPDTDPRTDGAAAPDPRADRAGTTPHPADLAKGAEPARPRSTAGNPFATGDSDPLLPAELTSRLNGRIDHAVGTFVDDPGRAVQEADEALDETVRELTDRLHERRTALRDAWRADGDRDSAGAASRTEDLRLSLRAYRDLLQHLLAA